MNSAGISFLRILLINIPRGLTQADLTLAIRHSMRVLASLCPGISAKGQKVFVPWFPANASQQSSTGCGQESKDLTG